MMKIIALAGCLMAGLRTNAWCLAVTPAAIDPDTVQHAALTAAGLPGGWELLMKTAGSMVVIVLLIFAVVFFLRRFVLNRNGLGSGAGAIRILSSSFIGPKKSIHLVKVLNRVLVLGVSETHIQTLSEFGAEEVDRLLPQAAMTSGEPQAFSKIIHSFLKRTGNAANT